MNAPDPRAPAGTPAPSRPPVPPRPSAPTAPPAASGAPRRAPTGRARRAGWFAVTALAAATALLTSRYLTLDPEVFLDEQRAVYLANELPLVLHVGGGVLAILLGPWQFLPRLRARRPGLHRVIGRLYLVTVVATGAAGLVLVPKALVGPIAPIGFGALDVLLLLSTAVAWRAVRRGDIARHRAWMTRSYALIFAGATLRVWLVVMDAVGVPFDQAYAAAAWTCWLINLVVAEYLIARAPAPAPAPPRHVRPGDPAPDLRV
ncbi:DUF2306 domain-containing protein [Kitasatospora sp. NBC_00458]|uniref:DUF2306 domain-containing protein n=1 Tax=Kitasatospora sp. NBC_00458 TaxID=2903568 RepID=UPI002E1977DD